MREQAAGGAASGATGVGVSGNLDFRCDVRLLGPFAMTTSEGARVDFATEKEAAIVAVVLVSENFERSRAWLTSLLWSDRSSEQASASLRQALSRIRRALSEHGLEGILVVDRKIVQIRKGFVEVDLIDHSDKANQSLAMGAEFLEGMDIRDPAFEDWIRQFRRSLHASSSDWSFVEDDLPDQIDRRPSQLPETSASRTKRRSGMFGGAVEAIVAQRQLVERLSKQNETILEELRDLRQTVSEQEIKIRYLEELAFQSAKERDRERKNESL